MIAPDWRKEAQRRTAANAIRQDYIEPPKPNWSRVKRVFTELQSGKCAFCERKLGKGNHVNVEWDLEHFRPKSSVEGWPTTDMKSSDSRFQYNFQTGSASKKGYYLLSYDLRNYAAGCKVCNTTFKRNYFPVCGPRQLITNDFKILDQEMPLLLFPIGDWGDDPGEFFEFDGILPIPKSDEGFEGQKARVTIDFFRLDFREELLEERAEVIEKLWAAHLTTTSGASGDDLQFAHDLLNRPQSASCRHANCARSFVRLLSTDSSRARQIAIECSRFLASKHP